MKLTGGAVAVLVGIAAAAFGVYVVRKKIGALIDIPVKAFNAVNNAVPPSITFDQKQSDGTTKKVTVSGDAIKKANANGTNMGMVAWPSVPSSVPTERNWWDGLGYTLTDAEKENPFDPYGDIAGNDFIDNSNSW